MRPKSFLSHFFLLAAAGLLLAPLSSEAQTVVSEFGFTENSLASSDAEPVTTSSAITFGAGISGGTAGGLDDRLSIDCLATTPAGPATRSLDAQLGAAITNNQYSTFTVTIPEGETVNLTQLTFTYSTVDAFRYGMGVFTDKTGFALADRLDGLYIDGASALAGTIRTYDRTIDLSSEPALQGLTNTTVEFRIYTGDNSSSAARQHRFDNIVLSGVINPEPNPYLAWAGPGKPFGGDANGDGVIDGLAFLLGTPNVGDNALGNLPEPTGNANGLVMTFQALATADRGTAKLKLEYSNSLAPGQWTSVDVPGEAGVFNVGDVTFNITGTGPLNVTATISAAATGKLFARCSATE